MIVAISPVQAFEARPLAVGMVFSVLDVPLFFAPAEPPGLVARTVAAGQPFDEPIPIPLLPGMDDLQIETASVALAGGLTEQEVEGRAVSGGNWDLALAEPPGQSGSLTRISITGFRLTVAGRGLASNSNAVAHFDSGQNRMVAGGAAPAGNRFLHFLLQPLAGNSAGPPAAAAPHFAMPGGGRFGYGPALGGLQMTLGAISGSGTLPVTLSAAPGLAGRAFRLGLGFVEDGGDSLNGGLPNAATPFAGWQATRVSATFATRPEDVEISLVGPEGVAPASVASYPGELPATRGDTDLAPAMRAVARAALSAAAGADLGLKLRIHSPTGGRVLIAIPRPQLRYVRQPMVAPEALDLSLGHASLALAVPPGLAPSGLSFAIDGRYGPARLIDSLGNPAPGPRFGYRLAPGRRLAVRLQLSRTEQGLPLSRLALFGRGDMAGGSTGELLLSLYRGDSAIPASRHGAPVALPFAGSHVMGWAGMRLEKPIPPPHPAALWLVIEAGYGAFLHAIDTPDGNRASALVSDAADQWNATDAPPLVQACVDELDPATGEPAPLHPIALHGQNGLLHADIADVVATHRPAAFALRFLALAPEHAALMTAISQSNGRFPLSFSCRREARFAISDATLTYDPWTATG